jgi:hypothetical protein
MGPSENISYFQRDDDLQSTRGTIFKMKRVDERLCVIKIAFSKSPKTVRGHRHVRLGLIGRCTGVGLAYSLITRCIPVILLIPLELLDLSMAHRN